MARDLKLNKNKKEGKEKKGNFFKDSRAELKKVTWPTPKQLAQKTAIVLFLVLIISLIVFVLDTVFDKGYEFIMEKANKGTTQVVTENTVEVTSEDAVTEGIDLTNATEDTAGSEVSE